MIPMFYQAFSCIYSSSMEYHGINVHSPNQLVVFSRTTKSIQKATVQFTKNSWVKHQLSGCFTSRIKIMSSPSSRTSHKLPTSKIVFPFNPITTLAVPQNWKLQNVGRPYWGCWKLGILGATHWRSDITCTVYHTVIGGGFNHLSSIDKTYPSMVKLDHVLQVKVKLRNVKENNHLHPGNLTNWYQNWPIILSRSPPAFQGPSFWVTPAGWWLNQPHWNMCSSNGVISPKIGMKIKKYLKPPPIVSTIDGSEIPFLTTWDGAKTL